MFKKNLSIITILLVNCLVMISSCKKGSESLLKQTDHETKLPHSVVLLRPDSAYTVSTPSAMALDDNRVTNSLSISTKTATASKISTVSILPGQPPKSGGGFQTNLLPGGGDGGFVPFVATVYLGEGWANVVLNTTKQRVGDLTLTARVWGISYTADSVSWSVTYVYSRNLQPVSSSVETYTEYL